MITKVSDGPHISSMDDRSQIKLDGNHSVHVVCITVSANGDTG